MKRLTSILLLLLLPSLAFGQQVFPMADNTGSTVVENTGVGLDGTLSAGFTSDVDGAGPGGIWTGSLDLEGTKSIALGTSYSVASGSPFYVSAWFKLNATGATNIVLFGRTNASNYIISSTTTNLRVRLTSTNSDFAIVQDTSWHHYFINKTSADLVQVWDNGVQIGSGVTNTNTFNPSHIGTASTGAFFLNGRIAGVEMGTTNEAANVATFYAKGSSSNVVPVIINNDQIHRR